MERMILLLSAILFLSDCVTGQSELSAPAPVTATADPGCIRNIGGASRFRREQFITIHASPTDKEMGREDLDFPENELHVSYGREGGSRDWRLKQPPRIPTVPTGKGTAVLRLGIGREHNKSLKPTVRIVGQSLAVPDDWAGGDQAGRKNFFGMIEVPVPMDLVTQDTSVEITFPDDGGKVASATLQVWWSCRLSAPPVVAHNGAK